MTNYEKSQALLDAGVAKKHYTFSQTGCIVLDLGDVYAGYILPKDKYVDVASIGSHDFFGNIDLEKMMVHDVSNRDSYNRHIKKWEDAQ